MCDTDILLGGFGLFGGRGEYFGRIKVSAMIYPFCFSCLTDLQFCDAYLFHNFFFGGGGDQTTYPTPDLMHKIKKTYVLLFFLLFFLHLIYIKEYDFFLNIRSL